jgi:hypothetical protein
MRYVIGCDNVIWLASTVMQLHVGLVRFGKTVEV